MDTPPIVRRPLKTRNTRWASSCACALAGMGLRPNQISVLSVVFAALAGAAILGTGQVGSSAARIILWVLAALFIQCRLLCNLFDGMVAVEGGFRTKSGEVYNDFPDRLSDVFILVPAGYVAGIPFGIELGWLAGLLAVMTAYVRVLAGACGAKQHFLGPMAKPHRMAVLTLASLLAAGEIMLLLQPKIIGIALIVIVFGSVWTVIRRLNRLISELEER